MCLKCLLADPITDYSNAHQYASFYDEGIASNRVRSCMSNTSHNRNGNRLFCQNNSYTELLVSFSVACFLIFVSNLN